MTPTIDTRKLTRWYDFQAPLYRMWRHRYDAPLVERTVSIVRDPGDAGLALRVLSTDSLEGHLIFELGKGTPP